MGIPRLKEKRAKVKAPGGNGRTAGTNWKPFWLLERRPWCEPWKILKLWTYLRQEREAEIVLGL